MRESVVRTTTGGHGGGVQGTTSPSSEQSLGSENHNASSESDSRGSLSEKIPPCPWVKMEHHHETAVAAFLARLSRQGLKP